VEKQYLPKSAPYRCWIHGKVDYTHELAVPLSQPYKYGRSLVL